MAVGIPSQVAPAQSPEPTSIGPAATIIPFDFTTKQDPGGDYRIIEDGEARVFEDGEVVQLED
jgi:hypothetical protein